MDREILFRGKDDSGIVNYDWLYGSLNNTDPQFPQIMYCDRFWNVCSVIVTPETIGQYTGLKDKNGRKIFEGDIVKGCSKSYKKNYLCEVYFNENMCHYGLTINRGSYTKHQTHDWLELTKTKASKLEVIGNIYDNPELLEGL